VSASSLSQAPVRVRLTTTSRTKASRFTKPKNDAILTDDFVRKREHENAQHRLESPPMSGNHESANVAPPPQALAQTERLAYSVEEAAELLGVHYFSVYRMIQRGKLRACRVLRGKLLVPRSELLKLLKTE
jgi:excisionase family DNA binding protein